MKIKRILSVLAVCIFALAGFFSAGMGIFAAFYEPDARPVMLRQPQQAYHRAVEFLSALEAGRLQAGADCLLGQPDLGADRPARDAAGRVLWDAFVHSFSWEILGDCYAAENGVSLQVSITTLDMDASTASLGERVQVLLQQRLDNARSMEEIYDASGNYLDSLLRELLAQAATEALAEEGVYITRELTLSMIWQDGCWWILPDPALLDTISCGLLS